MGTLLHNAETVARGPRAQPPADAGRAVLGRYEPIRRLGSGGFGTVWLARDLKLGRLVALKRIAVSDPGVAERARRESLAAARLQHPSIVSLYEAVADDEAFYLVSEHVRGATLAELQREGALSDLDVLEIGVGLCDALSHAHKRGVIHRDVKPQNVIIPDTASADGSTLAKLTDFGVARLADDDALTMTGDVVGTLAYMAPEQAEGRECSAASDLYALALCLYEALSGINPVRARGAAATARRVGKRLPPIGRLRRDLPLELCNAIDAAVAGNPAERGTLGELREALGGAIQDVTDEPGRIAGTTLDPLPGVATRRSSVRERAIAAATAAPLAYFAFGNLPVSAPADPLVIAAVAAGLVAALPRAGWIAGALAICAWLVGSGENGAALLVLVAAAPVPPILLAWPGLWSASGGAPLLGIGGVAGLFPALVGQLPGALQRAALAATGAWWALLAGPLTGIDVLAGIQPPATLDWSGDATATVDGVIAPLVTGPAVGICAVWAVAALVLPWIVRGQNLSLDIVIATTWTATVAAATQALAAPGAPSVVPGAVLAGVAAIAFVTVRGSPRTVDLT